ncbi:putative nuclease HARBI1 [Prorops nasuta]|uniref:putative nuclease HARBI1 n=1 Tax=Prorops nasuta TaxID=863751 RepID=UPI0034CF64B4
MENEFLSSSECSDDEFEAENVNITAPRRYIRDVENPIEYYDDIPFQKRYRFTKEAVMDILLPMVNEQLKKVNNRGLPVTPLMQLLITLRFYATSSFQVVNGDLRKYNQSTISRTVARTSRILASHLGQHINFFNNAKREENKIKFHGMAGFPNVIGCIDCTHIRISNPGKDYGEVFRNRKGWYSLNVQVVCGPNREILDLVARHPGSAHDALIFDRSGVRCRFEQGLLNGVLLGDSGYPCRSYLLTPVLRPVMDADVRYNTAHRRTRIIVEQLFGVWKRRFPCLYYGLRTKLSTSVAIICATATLYNIIIKYRLNIECEDDFSDDDQILNEVSRENSTIGFAHRQGTISLVARR